MTVTFTITFLGIVKLMLRKVKIWGHKWFKMRFKKSSDFYLISVDTSKKKKRNKQEISRKNTFHKKQH